MKTINKACQILTIVSGVAVLVLFFTTFANVITTKGTIAITGAQLSFGSVLDKTVFGKINLAKSADILFCLLLTAFAILFASLTFKYKGVRYASPATALAAGIYMLVISLSAPVNFVDTRPLFYVSAQGTETLKVVTGITYGSSVLIATILLLVTAAFGIAHLLIDDHLIIESTKGAKLTIPKRFVRFLRDYKSEVKKVVWPGPRAVVKNTLVVLSMCLLVGAFIWLLDFGLGQLLTYLLGK